MSASLRGRVVKIEGTRSWVDLDEDAGEPLACVVAGRLKKGKRKSKQPCVVGDRVHVELQPTEEGAESEGQIVAVEERSSWLSRRSAGSSRLQQVVVANVDRLLIVNSLASPPFRAGLIDRMLVAAAQGHLEPLICLNKVDEDADLALAEEQLALYRELGYETLICSAVSGRGLAELAAALRDRSTVLAGHSGVGKSTLLNAISPGLELATGAVSSASSKGRHTTTWVSLLRLAGGGYVVDTPGIRSFSIWDLDPADLDIYFREFEPLIERCRFPDCTHTHEPKCAVKDAVEAGEVSASRYESYLAIRESILEDERGWRR